MEKVRSQYCNCLYYSANALARVLTKISDEEFSVTGLSSSYAFLLMTVNSKPGIQPKEIGRQMQLTPSTITRLIEKMERKGFLERITDGRSTKVMPTKKSIDLNVNIKKAWGNLYTRYSKLLGKDFADKLTDEIYTTAIKLEESK